MIIPNPERFDYAKFIFKMERDRATQYVSRLKGYYDTYQRNYSSAGQWHFGLGSSATATTVCFMVDVSGEMATFVSSLPIEFAKYLQRLDVRAPVPDLQCRDITFLSQRFVECARIGTVDMFRRRGAVKNHKRDTGGYGFRLGSRKSQICGVVYQRGFETPAIEARFTGAALRHAVKETCKPEYANSDGTDRVAWLQLRTRLWATWVNRWNRYVNYAMLSEDVARYMLRVPIMTPDEASLADDIECATLEPGRDKVDPAQLRWSLREDTELDADEYPDGE